MTGWFRAAYRDKTAEDVHSQRWLILLILCLCLTVTGIDNTILNVAVPSIVRELGAKGSQLQWLIDAYTIVFAGLLLTMGTLGDKYGRKLAMSMGLIFFGGFSLLAALAQSSSELIAARALMGLGGALIFPTTLSILTNTFNGAERAKAIGIWAGVSGVGIAIGPLLGGLLLEHFWWGSVFLINVPVCATALIVGQFVLPNSRDPADHKLDIVGAMCSIIGLAGVLFAIIEAPDRGWGSGDVLAGFVVGFGFLAAFIWWELRTAHPMLELRFFRNPRFSAASSTIMLVYFALFGSTFLLTEYFQFVLGYSPLKSGAMTGAVAIGLIAAAPNAPRLVNRIGTKLVVVLGLSTLAAMLFCYTSNTLMSNTVTGWLVRMIYGAGLGLTVAPCTESIMGSLPKERAGVGSAVNDTTRQVGGALGVAILGSILAARYHSLVAGASGVPAAVKARAHDSIGKAIEAAKGTHAATARQITTLAKHSFLSGSRMAYTAAALVVCCAVFVTAKWLPARAPSEDELEKIADQPIALVEQGLAGVELQ
ncbi:MAG: Drug resistance transporter, EmrB/QacA subfamily [Actinomycetia bacterium]|nr:Drug resistance transporter, EmrB/QacA subfamily [Actinomycetes bacterium]